MNAINLYISSELNSQEQIQIYSAYKIFLNQNNVLELKDKLKRDFDSVEALYKDIFKDFGYDIRAELYHEGTDFTAFTNVSF